MAPTRKRKASKGKSIDTDRLIDITIKVLSFIGAVLCSAWLISSNVATKPYVDQGLADNRKYTDSALEKAISHSDLNRREMTIDMQQVASELQSQGAEQGAKLNLLLETVRQLQAQEYRQRR